MAQIHRELTLLYHYSQVGALIGRRVVTRYTFNASTVNLHLNVLVLRGTCHLDLMSAP